MPRPRRRRGCCGCSTFFCGIGWLLTSFRRTLLVTPAARVICTLAGSLLAKGSAYGAEAGNLALRGVATSGLYVGGGIAPKILNVLESVQIQKCPVLTDEKLYPEAEIGILTGSIRTEHDRHAALEMRKKCRTIIAFGTCAVYGGLHGAGLAHSREEIMDHVYRKSPTTRTDAIPATLQALDAWNVGQPLLEAWLAGRGGTSVLPWMAMPPLKYAGRYRRPSGASRHPSIRRSMVNTPAGVVATRVPPSG